MVIDGGVAVTGSADVPVRFQVLEAEHSLRRSQFERMNRQADETSAVPVIQ